MAKRYRIVEIKQPHLAPEYFVDRKLWYGIWYQTARFADFEEAKKFVDFLIDPKHSVTSRKVIKEYP